MTVISLQHCGEVLSTFITVVCPQTFYFFSEDRPNERGARERVFVYPPPTPLRSRSSCSRGFYFRLRARRSFEKLNRLLPQMILYFFGGGGGSVVLFSVT